MKLNLITYPLSPFCYIHDSWSDAVVMTWLLWNFNNFCSYLFTKDWKQWILAKKGCFGYSLDIILPLNRNINGNTGISEGIYSLFPNLNLHLRSWTWQIAVINEKYPKRLMRWYHSSCFKKTPTTMSHSVELPDANGRVWVRGERGSKALSHHQRCSLHIVTVIWNNIFNSICFRVWSLSFGF